MREQKAKHFEYLTSLGLNAEAAWEAWRIATTKPFHARKIVFIAHPVGGDVEFNLSKLRLVIVAVHRKYPDVVPFCPYYADVVSLGDGTGSRARGIANVHSLLRSGLVDEVWLTGGVVTKGMAGEVRVAEEEHIPVLDKLNEFP